MSGSDIKIWKSESEISLKLKGISKQCGQKEVIFETNSPRSKYNNDVIIWWWRHRYDSSRPESKSDKLRVHFDTHQSHKDLYKSPWTYIVRSADNQLIGHFWIFFYFRRNKISAKTWRNSPFANIWSKFWETVVEMYQFKDDLSLRSKIKLVILTSNDPLWPQMTSSGLLVTNPSK